MKQFLKTLTPFAIFIYCSTPLFSQKDTEFWFVAPNILENVNQQYDRPTAFRFSCYDQAATVTISQPANPSYPPQIINLPPNSTTNLDFPPFFDFIENFPPNTVLNKGFSIKSTTPISVYYEVIGGCKCNPEIFSLKGRNALGTKFYVPFQRLLNNASPMGRDAAFDIVATENNTEVLITPTKNIVGHVANTPFTITLHKGQTYSGQASSILAIDRPTGTKVESNKPIAITMKDDLLDAGPVYGGFCRDMIGDQIVPVHKTGTKYVISKGYLTGGEVGYVVATQDGTVVKRDGVTIGIINAGEDKAIVVEGHHFIETSKPAYLLQLTGIGCETSGEVLPSLDCSGSEQIRFVRSTDESFYMFLIIRNGNQDAFILNGNTFSISAASFSVVPGSNGEWVTAVLPFNNNMVPAEQSSEIRNTKGLFHLGVLNGSPSVTGSRFGFFSDFGNIVTVTDTIKFCIGDTVFFREQPIFTQGIFRDTVTTDEGCDTIFVAISQYDDGYTTTLLSQYFCQGDTAIINGNIYTDDAIATDTVTNLTGCDTIQTIILFFGDYIKKSQTRSFCEGSSLVLDGINYTSEAIVKDTLYSAFACDTILTTTILKDPRPTSSRTVTLCPGQSIIINGNTYSKAGVAIDIVLATFQSGCDTIRTTNITFFELQVPFLSADTNICAGEKIRLESKFQNTTWSTGNIGTAIEVTAPGIYIATAFDENNCPVMDTVIVEFCCKDRGIYVPNVFSPDKGENGIFKAFPIETCKNYILRIWDRWGELIFESRDSEKGWDGTFRGKSAPVGVYIWTIEFNTTDKSRPEILKGSVTLVN